MSDLYELSVSRLIKASPETVWRIFVERTGEWFCPRPWTTPVVDWDLRVGGRANVVLQSPEGESLYRACSTNEHHHHLICRNCGLTVEIEADAVERWAKDVAAQNGFTEAAHVVDVFGLCAACTATSAAPSSPASCRWVRR